MENSDTKHLIPRRRFIGSLAMATAAGVFLNSCSAPKWKIGIYTRPWNKLDYKQALDNIAKAGFQYVGMMSHKGGRVISQETSPEEAAAIYAEAQMRGLEIASISGYSYNKKISPDDNIAALKRLIDNSRICKCPNLMMNGVSDLSIEADYYKTIAASCDYAESKGVELTLKPHGGTNATGAQCRAHIKSVGHKNFNLWYDPGNIYYYSDGAIDPVADCADVDGLVTGMCVKDFKMPKDVNVTPGTGLVDFPGLFKRLRQGGFREGSLIIECLDNVDGSQLISEAIQARKMLEELVA